MTAIPGGPLVGRAVLSIRDVVVVRGGTPILDGVSWTVHEGQRWVVLGPNGAGKTTLLDVAGARLHPTRGAVEILDEQLGLVDVFDLRERIGVVSPRVAGQIPAEELVSDVVVTAAWAVTGRWREQYDEADVQRSRRILEVLGVAHLAERTFGTLSDGERKRVQIARALMIDPEVLLLDEPAAGLDLGAREDLVARLAGLAVDPASPVAVLVTHHVEEIPPGYTHALVMTAGRIVAAGPIGEVITDSVLSAAFDLPLRVSRVGRRFWATRRL